MSVLGAILRTVVALLACAFPRETWVQWSDRLPVFRMALPSAVLTLGAGVAFGVVGYLDFAVEAASQTNAAMLRVAQNQADTRIAGQVEASAGMTIALTILSALTYSIFTLRGATCTYLALTGLYRTMAAVANDPRGDPTLGLLRRAGRRLAGKTREGAARRERERREGRETPDRLLTGPEAGLPRAELVVVASRRKADWTPGAVLVTRQGYFRVAPAVERDTPDGLRTLYPLAEVGQAEVMRKMIRCELPRLENPLPEHEPVLR